MKSADVLARAVAVLVRRWGHAAVAAAVAAEAPELDCSRARGRPTVPLDDDLPALRRAAALWAAAEKPESVWPYLVAAVGATMRHVQPESGAKRLYSRISKMSLDLADLPAPLDEFAAAVTREPLARAPLSLVVAPDVVISRLLGQALSGRAVDYRRHGRGVVDSHHAALCVFLLDALPTDDIGKEIILFNEIIKRRPNWRGRLNEYN